MKRLLIGLCGLLALSGCGVAIERVIEYNDDRYARPGAMDSPLTGYYDIYQIKFLDRYSLVHEWPVVSPCGYSKLATINSKGERYKGEVYAVSDIYEEGNSTKQRGAHPAWDLDRYVRSVIYSEPIYAPITKEESEASVRAMLEQIKRQRKTGKREPDPPSTRVPLHYEEKETGFQPICTKYWWASSHYLDLSLRKSSLAEYKEKLTRLFPEGQWSTQTLNGLAWQVQAVPESHLEGRPLNGLGGPYQTWLLPLADTDYIMALKMGASKESLQYPQAHAVIHQAFRHLIESVRVEPLMP